MRIPKIQGLIRRRVLVNFRVDPTVIQRSLPGPFRPKLLGDVALAGICLIRLERIRPRPLPQAIGCTSENAAHRVAVRWTAASGQEQEGVYIPRRDSSSCLNHLVGGRLFPGEHHRAVFDIHDEADAIDISMRSLDGSVAVQVRGKPASRLPPTSHFRSLEEASSFFERGSLGYSATRNQDRFDGLHLVTRGWHVEPLEVQHVQSSFFSDPSLFPPGSVEFDCALLMRNIDHEWNHAPDLSLRKATAASRVPFFPRSANGPSFSG
jgi:Uncharacterized conserved protein (COG2071)